MNIKLKIDDKVVYANVPIARSAVDSEKWMKFIIDITRFAVNSKQLYILTLSPQKYSLGYELGSYKESTHGNIRVLINYFEHVTEQLLLEIIQSEEFERGLLKVALSDFQKASEELYFIDDDHLHPKGELITLADDGSSFYWYSSHFTIEEIRRKLDEILESI